MQLTDERVLLALLFACGVVAAVLSQVSLFAALVDLGSDDGAVSDQLVELRLEPIM